MQTRSINYWRDKQGHEIDFVFRNRSNNSLATIECKFTSASTTLSRSGFTAIVNNMKAFRNYYPQGKNYVVASDIEVSFEKHFNDLTISFVNTQELIKNLKTS